MDFRPKFIIFQYAMIFFFLYIKTISLAILRLLASSSIEPLLHEWQLQELKKLNKFDIITLSLSKSFSYINGFRDLAILVMKAVTSGCW
jgi:hypothetical protein